jgi:hypothetical protein
MTRPVALRPHLAMGVPFREPGTTLRPIVAAAARAFHLVTPDTNRPHHRNVTWVTRRMTEFPLSVDPLGTLRLYSGRVHTA